ncbi:MAG: hypothetical protein KC777_10165 [Cyanobacteria bacterium HKST-UBA02]|nr:hypothetical protein [Cyanobacteria bacterium HKST-UBA02]
MKEEETENRRSSTIWLWVIGLVTVLLAVLAALPMLKGELDFSSKEEHETRKTIKKALAKRYSRLSLPDTFTVEFRRVDNTWVSNAPVNDEDLIRLAEKESVDNLKVRESCLTAKGLEALLREPLVTLELHRQPVSPAIFPVIASLPRLERLSLRQTRGVSPAIEKLTGPHGLQSLNLEETDLDDDGLAHICKTFPNLTSLQLGEDLRITTTGLQAISNLRKLQLIDLTGVPVDRQALRAISENGKINRLCLDRCGITDDDLPALRSLPLYSLSLRRTNVSDRGLAGLSSMKSLKYVSVRGCKNVTEKGCAALAKKLPGLTVVLVDRVGKRKKDRAIIESIMEENNMEEE